MKLSEFRIRDPFVLPVAATGQYFMFGSTNLIGQRGPGEGFDCYQSEDLENWTGPIPAFRPESDFRGSLDHWAAEAHFHNGNYYMFATVKAPGGFRGTQIFISDHPQGPYRPLTEDPITPKDWECLDGTLYVDREQTPWIIFCHEWTQVHNGGMWALQLSPNLKRAAGRPLYLFNASEAPWVSKCNWPGFKERDFPCYITDGPYLFETKEGILLMLWSSQGPKGYAMGIARSSTNRMEGPWVQDKEPLWEMDGGHGMIFKAFDARLLLTLHRPNSVNERAVFFEIEDTGKSIRLK